MKNYKLKNGLKVIINKKQTDSVTIQISVNVGSNNEKEGIRGISHFIEHMLFEGTKNRTDAKEMATEIESIGGEINAYTDNTRTCYYIKVPKKHFQTAIDILSDLIQNPLFRKKDIEKEREVILKEINIYNDESRQYQWILFQQALFKYNNARIPAYGTIDDVKAIVRTDIMSFYNTYYNAQNSVLTIVGDITNEKNLLEKSFGIYREGTISTIPDTAKEPEIKKPNILKTKRPLSNSYIVYGYQTTTRLKKDAYVLDVIQAILGKGQSGRMFDEIRNKRGLAYEVGVHHECNENYGFFAIYLSAHINKLPTIKKLLFKELNDLKQITKIPTKELKDCKGFIEGKYILDNEDTHNTADNLAFWEQIADYKLESTYLDQTIKVTKADIVRVAKKYFTNNYTMALIEQK